MKKKKIEIRTQIEREVWAEVKAQATRNGKSVSEIASELIKLGLEKLRGEA